MPRFDFKSAGGEFTDSITEMLAKRKAEERQNLLDSLSQNADTRAAHADVRAGEQAKQQELMNKDALASSQQQREIDRINAVKANSQLGDDLSDLSPEDAALYKRYHMLSTAPTGPDASATITNMSDESGQAPTDFAPVGQANMTPAPPKYTYAGSPKERDEEKQRKANGAIISQLLKDPKDGGTAENVKSGMYLAQRMAANNGMIPDEAWKEVGIAPPRHINIMHQSTGKITDGGTVPSNSETIIQGYHPRELRGPSLIDNGINPETGRREYINPENYTVHAFNGNRKGADNSENSLGVPQGTIQNYQMAVSGLDPAKVDPANLRTVRLAAGSVIAAAHVSGKIKTLANLAITDPNVFDAQMQSEVDLTERDVQQLNALLSELTNPEIKEVFRSNPATPGKEAAKPSGFNLTELLLGRGGSS